MKKLKKGTPEWNRFDCEQRAIKTVSNAAFGYTGFFAARWYKRECGASITAWGRMYIRKIMEMAKKEGFEIIYADTDGVFVKLPSKS
jgi:DNA polymerase elongation subunit (family B)